MLCQSLADGPVTQLNLRLPAVVSEAPGLVRGGDGPSQAEQGNVLWQKTGGGGLTRKSIFCNLIARGCGFKESRISRRSRTELRRTGLDDLDATKQRRPEQEKFWGKRSFNQQNKPQKKRREAGGTDGQGWDNDTE